ncbi:MAG: AEC family transporter [Desulfuromonadales bacterium]|nr:AEC family transporter [Desulfuromonadales bacterium]
MFEFFSVFIDVILPVFGIVLLGALLGRRLALEARTLTRAAYYVFAPAFIFKAISTADMPLSNALVLVLFIVSVHLATVFISGGIGRLFGYSREMIAAFLMIACFGNVGNFGLALIQFHLGDESLAPATIYFVAVSISAFAICVGAAGWAHGGSRGAVWKVIKTPALWATLPAAVVSGGDLQVPLVLERMIGLLSGAMIPVMLFALGLQLVEQGKVHLDKDVLLGSSIRLVLAPALAFILAPLFVSDSIESAAGILQAAMPAAIFVSIIAKENDIVPAYVTSVVVVSTLASLVTLSLLMVLL